MDLDIHCFYICYKLSSFLPSFLPSSVYLSSLNPLPAVESISPGGGREKGSDALLVLAGVPVDRYAAPHGHKERDAHCAVLRGDLVVLINIHRDGWREEAGLGKGKGTEAAKEYQSVRYY